MKKLLRNIILIELVFITACEKKDSLPVDGDGNEYHPIEIGTQTWLKENLRTTTLRDGSPIPLVTDMNKWYEATLPSYCWYDNSSYNKETYGALYNWHAAKLGLMCPEGYHIPKIEEWNTLIDYLGGLETAGGKLKETGNTYWKGPNIGATNESGFSARPGGHRDRYGNFGNLGGTAFWWTSSQYYRDSSPDSYEEKYAWRVYINVWEAAIVTSSFPKGCGYSVRCIKNN